MNSKYLRNGLILILFLLALTIGVDTCEGQDLSVIYGGGDIYEVVLRDSITVAYVFGTGRFAFTQKGMKFIIFSGDTLEIKIKDTITNE